MSTMLCADLSILQCPVTRQSLSQASAMQIEAANESIGKIQTQFVAGLVNEDGSCFFPISDEIYYLHPHYSIPLKSTGKKEEVEFDKERIFTYFNSIHYQEFDGRKIYDDDDQFVDFRDFLLAYTRHGFYNCRQYIDASGKYFVDAACGPVAYKEYVQLAEGYECRICIDLSVNALKMAQQNLKINNQPAIFICGDLTSLPLKDETADAVICQHALFHVQKKLQLTVLNELVRIAATEKKIAIVYDWFYHSWMMNIALGPYQLYRILRHWVGKVYARALKKNKLYFFAHSPAWFRKNHPGTSIQFYVWRSINIHFSHFYLHPRLGGARFIRYIWKMEERYPEKMGRLGEYPIIVIKK
ncbi:MAG: class I SAM-dependent methyltransferase [Chitinophagaceae bacterium]|nr:class I SAM-dependent methyltransferase [Chitinophagaceae bacterium]